jgi:chromosome segregation ATPase
MNRDVVPQRKRNGLIGRSRAAAEHIVQTVMDSGHAQVVAALEARLHEAHLAWAAENATRRALEIALSEAERQLDVFGGSPVQPMAPRATPQELLDLQAEVETARSKLAAEQDSQRAAEERATEASRALVVASATLFDEQQEIQRSRELLQSEQARSTELELALQQETARSAAANGRAEQVAEQLVAAEGELALETVKRTAAEATTREALSAVSRERGKADTTVLAALAAAERVPELESQLVFARRHVETLEEALRRRAEQVDDLEARLLASAPTSAVDTHREVEDLHAELAVAREQRADERARVAALEKDLQRRAKERDSLMARLQQGEGLAAQLRQAKEELVVLAGAQDEVEVQLQAAVDAAVAEAAAEIARLQDQLADVQGDQDEPPAHVPPGSVLVPEAALAAHGNHVRQLDGRRADEARRRVEAEERALSLERALAAESSSQRAAQQRFTESVRRYEALSATVLDLQRVADAATAALGLPPRSPGQLVHLIPDVVRRLQDRLAGATDAMAAKDAELERLRQLALSRRNAAAEASLAVEDATSAAPVVRRTGGGARADRLLEMLRQAADELKTAG